MSTCQHVKFTDWLLTDWSLETAPQSSFRQWKRASDFADTSVFPDPMIASGSVLVFSNFPLNRNRSRSSLALSASSSSKLSSFERSISCIRVNASVPEGSEYQRVIQEQWWWSRLVKCDALAFIINACVKWINTTWNCHTTRPIRSDQITIFG